MFVQARINGKVTVSDWVRVTFLWKTTSVLTNVFLRICFVCFMCYDIITSLDAVECDVVYHLFIIDILTASEMTFITVHLVIPGLDILFTECTDS